MPCAASCRIMRQCCDFWQRSGAAPNRFSRCPQQWLLRFPRSDICAMLRCHTQPLPLSHLRDVALQAHPIPALWHLREAALQAHPIPAARE